jgi:hypothetical protein
MELHSPAQEDLVLLDKEILVVMVPTLQVTMLATAAVGAALVAAGVTLRLDQQAVALVAPAQTTLSAQAPLSDMLAVVAAALVTLQIKMVVVGQVEAGMDHSARVQEELLRVDQVTSVAAVEVLTPVKVTAALQVVLVLLLLDIGLHDGAFCTTRRKQYRISSHRC